MAMRYDLDIFTRFKNLSIQSVDQLVIGKTYYGNMRREFTLSDIVTWREMSKRKLERMRHRLDSDQITRFEESIATDDDTILQWMETTDGGFESCHDNNINKSYNPWLIFEDPEIAARCREELVVTFYRDDNDYWMDRWIDYDSNFDEEHFDEECEQ